MERTGTSFEMNPDSFTLENMFAMELHKYADVIGDIVTSAVKELGIEKASFHLCELFQTGVRHQVFHFASEIINPYKTCYLCVCICVCASRE